VVYNEHIVLRSGRRVDPVYVYSHGGGECGVIGRYVYRGMRVPAARGRYFFGDLCSGVIWSFKLGRGGGLSGHQRRALRAEPQRGVVRPPLGGESGRAGTRPVRPAVTGSLPAAPRGGALACQTHQDRERQDGQLEAEAADHVPCDRGQEQHGSRARNEKRSAQREPRESCDRDGDEQQ
jgi:hypothetical protein